ncbi:acyl-CoA dehydrogenase [Actinokineospora sp. NBRC 105648]|uniref:acyl-CoA dehydrogenase n=1 Tax=Actinokineospora sp. NBRC 105648 TaxID=3032206 RepID=UPI0024A4B89B|nr:acyl-CoA dehydrogenase [Actinokineospora sp. NBRC 105648]GLZ41079.1 acyl-CoA dehydrogenase [Actinokineospora sp. NBRC 105648]
MSATPKRADHLEALLGSLSDVDNPVGSAAILDADERAEPLVAGEAVLAAFDLNAELVPPEHGGRFDRVDHLVEVLRSVYRRDPALGLGYAVGSLIAGVAVWTAADTEQAARAARLLLGGGRIAAAFHELAHGNDIAAAEFTATPSDGGFLLSGRKEVIAGIGRASAAVIFARTDPSPGPRSHSLLLVEPVPGEPLPRFTTAGVRGVWLGGVAVDRHPVPESAVLGRVGGGLETVLKAFQVTRTALPAMATGVLDTGLRIAVDHLSTRRLYGGAAIDLPHVRSVLAAAFADLLRAEAFATVAARALHLVPGSASVYSAAVKIEVSRLLLDAMDRLAELLGAHSYLREGPSGLFQKLLRDLAPVGFGHIARATAQLSLLPQLPTLARRSWAVPGPVPVDLLDLDADLPPLRYDRLALHASGRDPLTAGHGALLDSLPPGPVRAAAAADRAELAELARVCAGLPVAELGADARPAHYDLVTRYVLLLVRTACLGVWRHAPPGDFLADPAWPLAALHRCAPGRTTPLPGPVEDALVTELLDRHGGNRSFGGTARPLAS